MKKTNTQLTQSIVSNFDIFKVKDFIDNVENFDDALTLLRRLAKVYSEDNLYTEFIFCNATEWFVNKFATDRETYKIIKDNLQIIKEILENHEENKDFCLKFLKDNYHI